MRNSDREVHILVTAVGSELAFAVIKAIKHMSIPHKLYGCDIYPEVVGKYWVDGFSQIPPVREKARYLDSIKNLIEENKIDYIIPTADAEFFLLPEYKNEFREKFDCEILANDLDQIVLFNDKWKTFELFKKLNIGVPNSFLGSEERLDEIRDQLDFPLIVKPRTGGGSRFVFKVDNSEQLRHVVNVVPDAILQEYLSADEEEYTAGTFRDNDEVHVIVLKRKLKFGMTNSAEVVQDPGLVQFCKELIRKTELTGSNNIQFRLQDEKPKVLEVNPRFSGTTGIRAHFGYNEIEMWIRQLGGQEVLPPKIKKGKVLRYMNELYLD